MKPINPHRAKEIIERKRARARQYYRRNAARINRRRRLQYKKVTTLAGVGEALANVDEETTNEHDD